MREIIHSGAERGKAAAEAAKVTGTNRHYVADARSSKDWADKAEALASYARQSKDDHLRKMADRIQARAVRRCGVLLKEIESAKGKRTDLQPTEGDHSKSRKEAAREAGLSEHQQNTALRVANVPAEQFEEAVESGATAHGDRTSQGRYQ